MNSFIIPDRKEERKIKSSLRKRVEALEREVIVLGKKLVELEKRVLSQKSIYLSSDLSLTEESTEKVRDFFQESSQEEIASGVHRDAQKMIAELKGEIPERPIMKDLKDRLQYLVDTDTGIKRAEISILYGAPGNGRGGTGIHIVVPSDSKFSEE